MADGYDKSKDVVLFKEAVKQLGADGEVKTYYNVEAFQYDGGTKKVRIKPVSKNTNPNAQENQKWINLKALSGITGGEIQDVINALEKAKAFVV